MLSGAQICFVRNHSAKPRHLVTSRRHGGTSITLQPVGANLCLSSYDIYTLAIPSEIMKPISEKSFLLSNHHPLTVANLPLQPKPISVISMRVVDRGPWPSTAVGTVCVSPSTSPPNFPLGSWETEVKVAAGALGAGQLESRWGEYNATRAGSGLPTTAGGLIDRSEEGLPMEMRAWRNWSVDP